jgi:flavin-dependent dehydrogenase
VNGGGADAVDVLVVGAGPAGSMAALTLARAGARVRLLDRAQFPRDKLCGDTVNPGALATLDEAGLGDAVRARGLAVRGMTVSGAGATVSASYPRGLCGVALTRRDLDALLVGAAAAAGARFEERVTVLGPALSADGHVAGVRVASGSGAATVPARLVIAADGRGSRLAAGLSLARFARAPRRWAFGAYYAGVAGVTRFGEMHVGRAGYLGIAPLPGGVANVCVVRTAAGRRHAPRVDQRRVLADAIDADPVIRERFRRAQPISAVSVLGPLAVDARSAGCPGLLLAGDAAGFVDPMTGDGLRFALRGGELAAAAALDELATGRPAFAALHAARSREFQGKWRLNRALRMLVGSPGAVQLAARVASYWPAPIEHLVALAGDVHLAAVGAGPR